MNNNSINGSGKDKDSIPDLWANMKAYERRRRLRPFIRVSFGIILFIVGNGLFLLISELLGVWDLIRQLSQRENMFLLYVLMFFLGLIYLGYIFVCAFGINKLLHKLGVEWWFEDH